MEQHPDIQPLEDDEGIREDYREQRRRTIGKYGQINAILAIGIFPVFIYGDLIIRELPPLSIGLRLLPMLFGLLMIILSRSAAIRNGRSITVVYFCFLFSLMIMTSGLLAIVADSERFNTYVLGMVVIIFCAYAASFHGMRVLIPVYGIPMGAVGIYLIGGKVIPPSKIALLANPLATAVVCLFIAEYQEKNRFREYVSRRIIARQNEQLHHELALARSIQRALIPRVMPLVPGLRMAAEYHPVSLIGGDFYDIITMDDPALTGIFIADVSGHGVSAALVASMVKTLVTTSAPGERAAPVAMLQFINDALRAMAAGHFVTAFYGIYDSFAQSFTYARGGHHAPLMVRDGVVTELSGRGRFLGVTLDNPLEERRVHLRPGDRIFLYTDGLVEARDPENRQFDTRLHDMLAAMSALPIDDALARIIAAARGFAGPGGFDDDVCILGLAVE